MKYLILIFITVSSLWSYPLPIDSHTILVLNSFYFVFIIVMFFVFGVEQVFTLFKRVRNA